MREGSDPVRPVADRTVAVSPARLSWPSSLPLMVGSMRKRGGDRAALGGLLLEHLGVVVEPAQQPALAPAGSPGSGSRPCAPRRASMAASSASMPSPVSAETSTGGAVAARPWRAPLPCARPRRAGRPCSTPPGSARRPPPRRCRDRASTASTSRALRFASRRGEMSRTCRMRSASITSSSVARKAATSVVGRSEMKPTVSDRMMRRPLGELHLAHGRIERREHLVLGEDGGAGEAVEQRRLAGVGVADDRHHRIRHALAARAVQRRACARRRRDPCGCARCAPRSGAGRSRSALRRGRRGSRSRRAGAPRWVQVRTSRLFW